MQNLESLLNDLANFDAQHDLEGLKRVRQDIVAHFPDSDAAVEATYKLGLDLLFRDRDLDGAVVQFTAASKRKHPYWSAASRTSLALCYYHQQRTQKALLELRKVGYVDTPTAHSVTALAFLENILATMGHTSEMQQVRKDRMNQLRTLIAACREHGEQQQELGFYLFHLALAHADNKEDDRKAELLAEAKAIGRDKLGADLYRSIVDAASWR